MGSCNYVFAGLVATSAILFWNFNIDFSAHKYSFPSPPEFTGPLTPNKDLQNANLILKGKILGPESILVEGDTLYTGTWDGKVLQIVNGQIKKTIYLNHPLSTCATYDTEPVCGRPLGIRRFNKDLLVVADTYHGIYTVNVAKSESKLIFSSKTVVGGYASKFLNDLDVVDEDTIIVTDSSTKYGRRQFFHVVLANAPDGRVIEVKVSTGKAKILLYGLRFPNGVQLHPNKDSVIISECTMARILRLYIKGEKVGEVEVFANNLPGLPDNIRLSKQGTFYVGLANPRKPGQLNFVDLIGPYPWIRSIIMSVIPERTLVTLFGKIHAHYGLVVELNHKGDIIKSYHDPEGKVIADVSQVSDDDKYLYLGSFRAPFIAQVPKRK
ncbi:unnamed protein product [Bursaphelenchus xylophilus]|uniref:(pine wood nematode) hypothetical protein n=1 Tax=Bursaphelenchus xylophilus TaxID=6326 RepID=A0A1I7RPR6_BURXY|nr:unnamed protein product [Bursaphelenchus xylophilus]CAG9096494.1 unnamed protein product [Bursaphelenchus xylophilus]